MKSIIFITLLSLLEIVPNCNLKQHKQEFIKIEKTSDTVLSTIIQTNKEGSEEQVCPRGQAEPIIIKTVYQNSSFILLADSITGIETVPFENGDTLIIRNWGCEHYCLTFRFETSRFQEDTMNLQFWFKNSVLLMSEILKGIDAPIDIKKGTQKLINYIDLDLPNNYENLKLGEEIDFDEGGFRKYVSVDRIQKIDERKYAIEISYVMGPL